MTKDLNYDHVLRSELKKQEENLKEAEELQHRLVDKLSQKSDVLAKNTRFN